MASGHVNRVNRPNTWLHRPMLQTFKKVLANSEPSTHGGKADTTVCGSPLSWSLLGVKRTCPFALHMSAFDPKRTFLVALHIRAPGNSLACLSSRANLQAPAHGCHLAASLRR